MELGAQVPPAHQPTGALRPQQPAQTQSWQQQPVPLAWGPQHPGLPSLPPGTPAEGSPPLAATPGLAGQPLAAAAPAMLQPVLQLAEPAAQGSPPAQPALPVLSYPQPPAAAAGEGGGPTVSWPLPLGPPSAPQPPWLQEGEGAWSVLLTSQNFPARLSLPRSGPGDLVRQLLGEAFALQLDTVTAWQCPRYIELADGEQREYIPFALRDAAPNRAKPAVLALNSSGLASFFQRHELAPGDVLSFHSAGSGQLAVAVHKAGSQKVEAVRSALGLDSADAAAWLQQQQREEQCAQQLSRSSSRAASPPALPPLPERRLLGPAGEAKRARLRTSALASREAAVVARSAGFSTPGALQQPQAWQPGASQAETRATGEPLSAQLRQQLGAAMVAATIVQQGQGEIPMRGHALLADGAAGGWLAMGSMENGEAAAVGGSPMLTALVEGQLVPERAGSMGGVLATPLAGQPAAAKLREVYTLSFQPTPAVATTSLDEFIESFGAQHPGAAAAAAAAPQQRPAEAAAAPDPAAPRPRPAPEHPGHPVEPIPAAPAAVAPAAVAPAAAPSWRTQGGLVPTAQLHLPDKAASGPVSPERGPAVQQLHGELLETAAIAGLHMLSDASTPAPAPRARIASRLRRRQQAQHHSASSDFLVYGEGALAFGLGPEEAAAADGAFLSALRQEGSTTKAAAASKPRPGSAPRLSPTIAAPAAQPRPPLQPASPDPQLGPSHQPSPALSPPASAPPAAVAPQHASRHSLDNSCACQRTKCATRQCSCNAAGRACGEHCHCLGCANRNGPPARAPPPPQKRQRQQQQNQPQQGQQQQGQVEQAWGHNRLWMSPPPAPFRLVPPPLQAPPAAPPPFTATQPHEQLFYPTYMLTQRPPYHLVQPVGPAPEVPAAMQLAPTPLAAACSTPAGAALGLMVGAGAPAHPLPGAAELQRVDSQASTAFST